MWVEDLRACGYDAESVDDEVDRKTKGAMMLEEGRNRTRSGDKIAISIRRLERYSGRRVRNECMGHGEGAGL
jgi:hypothetical protein